MRRKAVANLSEPGAGKVSGISRRGFLLGVSSLGLGSVLEACRPVGRRRMKGRNAMVVTSKRLARDSVIPPIDAASPARTETATFALG
jgi:hypothetical protein